MKQKTQIQSKNEIIRSAPFLLGDYQIWGYFSLIILCWFPCRASFKRETNKTTKSKYKKLVLELKLQLQPELRIELKVELKLEVALKLEPELEIETRTRIQTRTRTSILVLVH